MVGERNTKKGHALNLKTGKAGWRSFAGSNGYVATRGLFWGHGGGHGEICGEVAEWFKAAVLKTGRRRKSTVSSNLSPLRQDIALSDCFCSDVSGNSHLSPQIGPQTVACWFVAFAGSPSLNTNRATRLLCCPHLCWVPRPLTPFFLTLTAHRIARRVLGFEPRL